MRHPGGFDPIVPLELEYPSGKMQQRHQSRDAEYFSPLPKYVKPSTALRLLDLMPAVAYVQISTCIFARFHQRHHQPHESQLTVYAGLIAYREHQLGV